MVMCPWAPFGRLPMLFFYNLDGSLAIRSNVLASIIVVSSVSEFRGHEVYSRRLECVTIIGVYNDPIDFVALISVYI